MTFPTTRIRPLSLWQILEIPLKILLNAGTFSDILIVRNKRLSNVPRDGAFVNYEDICSSVSRRYT
jgi:hypothetical protein